MNCNDIIQGGNIEAIRAMLASPVKIEVSGPSNYLFKTARTFTFAGYNGSLDESVLVEKIYDLHMTALNNQRRTVEEQLGALSGKAWTVNPEALKTVNVFRGAVGSTKFIVGTLQGIFRENQVNSLSENSGTSRTKLNTILDQIRQDERMIERCTREISRWQLSHPKEAEAARVNAIFDATFPKGYRSVIDCQAIVRSRELDRIFDMVAKSAGENKKAWIFGSNSVSFAGYEGSTTPQEIADATVECYRRLCGEKLKYFGAARSDNVNYYLAGPADLDAESIQPAAEGTVPGALAKWDDKSFKGAPSVRDLIEEEFRTKKPILTVQEVNDFKVKLNKIYEITQKLSTISITDPRFTEIKRDWEKLYCESQHDPSILSPWYDWVTEWSQAVPLFFRITRMEPETLNLRSKVSGDYVQKIERMYAESKQRRQEAERETPSITGSLPTGALPKVPEAVEAFYRSQFLDEGESFDSTHLAFFYNTNFSDEQSPDFVKNCCRLLRIEYDQLLAGKVTEKELSKIYKAKALALHPDKVTEENTEIAQSFFQKWNSANQVILSEIRKRQTTT